MKGAKMEDEELSVNNSEVAEPETVVQESGAKEQETTEPVAVEEKEERDYQKDADFAAMRRALEAEQAKSARIEQERDRLMKSLGYYDFKGNSADEIADAAEAHFYGKTVDEVRNDRIAQQTKIDAENAKDAELEYYRQKEIERIMDDDLKQIQKVDPTVKSISELGDRFFNLIKTGVNALDAFNAIRATDSATKVVPPPEIGKVNSSEKGEKTYYTSAEVDAMIASNSKDLDNPEVLARIRKSMTKW